MSHLFDIFRGMVFKAGFVAMIAAFVLLSSCNKGGAVQINGNVSNLIDQEILISYFKSDSIVVDTVWSKSNGRFQYRNQIDTLTSFSLYFNDQSSSVVVFANPKDKITIKGDALVPDLIRVNGNSVNDELTAFKEQNKELLEYRSLLLDNYRTERLEKDSLHKDRILSENDELAKINSINQELIMHAEEYIQKNPSKLSSLILVNEFFANPENQKAFNRVMEYMQGDILKSKMALNLKNYLSKISRSAEGVSMPYFQMVDTKGDTINSYDFKGKHLLLSFVSGTGADSRETIETLKSVYGDLNKDSVAFVSVYIDPDNRSQQYIEQDSIQWKAVAERKSWASDVVDAYNIEFVPNNILISPEGIISDRNVPAVAVKNKLKNSSKNNH